MCGVAGILLAPGSAVRPAHLWGMAGQLAHRGPDDEGIFVGPGTFAHVGLAHRRLEVTDAKGGRQPMVAVGPAGEVLGAVAFNGQIYNHTALRRDLEQTGRIFRSDHSDTEVLLHQVLKDGPAALAKLSGMFAFAVLDIARGLLLLGRDHVGKKPLYVAGPAFFDGGPPRLAFASEPAALAVLPGARSNVEPVAVGRLLGFDFVPDPDSIWQGVFKLPPGAVLALPLFDPTRWPRDREGFVSALVHTDEPRFGQLPSSG
jgi:asparagine synthase (glutamine-hydrolysing)